MSESQTADVELNMEMRLDGLLPGSRQVASLRVHTGATPVAPSSLKKKPAWEMDSAGSLASELHFESLIKREREKSTFILRQSEVFR